MITKILVPADGSKAAQKAAKHAVNLAKQVKASVFVLSVIDERFHMAQSMSSSGDTIQPLETLNDFLREAAENYARQIEDLCTKNGIRSKVLITEGHPVEEIIKEAERLKASLIVMGSHGRSALAATVLGSVTYGVIHKGSKIPVMVVKG